MSVWNVMDDETPIVTSHREKLKKKMMRLRSCFELFEMFFEVKNLQFRPSARTEGNRPCSECRGEQQGKSLLLTFKQTIQNSF